MRVGCETFVFCFLCSADHTSEIGQHVKQLFRVGNEYCLYKYTFFSSFFLSLVSLIADGPHHYHPACGH